jgi:predicted RNase H-like nuclease
MRSVLGIDAAWTEAQPSGVALVEETVAGWRLRRLASSYQGFVRGSDGARPTGSLPDPAALLATCVALLGREPDLIAVDMPLSYAPITGRRRSDDCISRAYGARKAGTHTPSGKRPGAISDRLRAAFKALGYDLLVQPGPTRPGLIEVYPHPALIELTGACERLPYKASKARAYWPRLTERDERRTALFQVWGWIIGALEIEIRGTAAALPPLNHGWNGWELKAYEDMLDAVVCAWVGVSVLEGRARAFGDQLSAIWVPTG